MVEAPGSVPRLVGYLFFGESCYYFFFFLKKKTGLLQNLLLIGLYTCFQSMTTISRFRGRPRVDKTGLAFFSEPACRRGGE